MAKLYNLVRVQVASTGTGTLTLYDALPGYLTFAQAGASSGETVSYGIIDGNKSETGTGTYTVSGSTVTLTRNVTKSTNSNNAINVESGAIVYSTARAEDFNTIESSLTLTDGDDVTASSYSPLRLHVLSGSLGSPITAVNTPSVVISRFDKVNNGGDGSNGAALYIVNSSTGDAATPTQNVALTAWGAQSGSADTVGVYGVGTHSGTGTPRGAFGGFFVATATGNQSSALAIETQTTNNGSADRPYDPVVNSSNTVMTGIDINYSSTSAYLGGAAITIRSGGVADGRWDVGIGFMDGDYVKTACIQDDTDAINILLANSGAHTNGINLASATFSSNAYSSPGFTVGGTGIVTTTLANTTTAINYRSNGATSFGGYSIGRTAADGYWGVAGTAGHYLNNTAQGDTVLVAVNELHLGAGGLNTNSIAIFNTDGTAEFLSTLTASTVKLSGTSNQLVFQSAGVTGTISWAPSSSNKTITLPNGTTDFTATGGTGQVVKQASAGAAFTVGTVAVGEVSGFGTGVATFLATPSSANLASAVTDETGTGALVFANTPTLVTPNIGAATGTSLQTTGAIIASGASALMSITNDTSAFGVNSGAFEINSSSGSELGIRLVAGGAGGRAWGTFSTAGASGLGQGKFVFYDATTGGVAGSRMEIDSTGQVKITIDTAASSNITGALWVVGGAGFGKDVYLATGTTAIAPLTFTSGTNLTTARAGAMEYDGKVFYATSVASSRQVVGAEQLAVIQTDNTLADVNTAQNIFASGNDVLSLAASTAYEFEFFYWITRAAGTTSHTTDILFPASSAFTSIHYVAQVTNPTGNALAATQQIVGDVSTGVTITAANTSATENLIVWGRGVIRTNGASTVTPQFQYSAAPGGAPTVKVDSFFRIWPVGSNTVAAVGNWA